MDVTAEAAVGVTAVTRSLDCPNARRRVTETPERVRTGRLSSHSSPQTAFDYYSRVFEVVKNVAFLCVWCVCVKLEVLKTTKTPTLGLVFVGQPGNDITKNKLKFRV